MKTKKLTIVAILAIAIGTPIAGFVGDFNMVTLLKGPDGAAWWTFDFESFGMLDEIEGHLAATVANMAGRSPPAGG